LKHKLVCVTPDDAVDAQPLTDPAETLRVIRAQQAEAVRMLRPDPRAYYWPWGLAWLVGFGLYFLRFGPNNRVFIELPIGLPLTVLFVLLAAAGVFSGVAGARAYGHVTGDSERRGRWYGFAWFAGFAGITVTIIKVSGGMPEDLKGLLWAASSVGIVGALQMAGGAVWLDRDLFAVGTWVTCINFLGVLAGPGWHSLIVSLAGGGGMIIAGTVAWMRVRSTS
jgi:hypothetical protein